MKQRILSLLVLIFLMMSLHAQRSVTGNVNEITGEAVIGASVIVVSTNKGTATNVDGSFTVKMPEGIQSLTVSSIGYQDTVVVVGETQNNINIILREKVVGIDEVVVVGYGTQHKSEVTNAISSISFDDLVNIPQSNTINVLAGRLPGLTIINSSGEPGANDSEVKLRGIGTTGFSNPLIVIDGITSTMEELSSLMPSDIDNISVLKDAASTAIYGSRGAHGVILVTTKEPTIGKVRVDVNSQLSLQQATYLPKFVESWQWMTLQNEARKAGPLYPQDSIDLVRSGVYSDAFSNDDFVSSLFKIAPQNIHSINIGGGNNELSYNLSFGYVGQEGIMHNTNNSRYNYRARINSTVSKYLKVRLNLSGFVQNKHTGYEGIPNVMRSLLRGHPITPERYSNGDWGVYNSFDGVASAPPKLLAEIGRWDTKISNYRLQPSVIITPLKGLTINASLAYSTNAQRRTQFNPTYTYYAPDGTIGLENKINTLKLTNIDAAQIQSTTTANYTFAINRFHRFTFLGGYEFLDYKRTTDQAEGSGLPNNDQQVMYLAQHNNNATGERRDWVFESVFGRFNYSFKNKYFLQMNARMDGSSRLPVKNRYHVLSSFSGGWLMSNEKFFHSSSLSKYIDGLKLRAAYGQAGNDPLGQHRTYVQTMDSRNYYYFGDELIAGTTVNLLANEDMGWVVTTTQNYGVDVQLLNNKLDISLDVYDKLTEGIMYEVNLAPSFGYSEKFPSNLATATNKGVELDVKYSNVYKKLDYYVGFNAAYNVNEVTSTKGEIMLTQPFIMIDKQAFNSYYGYVFDGIVRDSSEIATTPTMAGVQLDLGYMKFKDLNGDGIIDDQDRKVIGNSNIPFELGLNGGLFYKGFDASILLHAILGKTIYLRDWGNRPTYSELNTFWKEWWDNRYHAENNPNGTWPSVLQGAPGVDEVSTFWLHDASYLRVKNLEIGYSLPNKTIQKLYLNRLRLYVAAQDFLTFSSLIKQIDPERESRRTGNTIYPQVKLFTVGLNVTF